MIKIIALRKNISIQNAHTKAPTYEIQEVYRMRGLFICRYKKIITLLYYRLHFMQITTGEKLDIFIVKLDTFII